MVGRGKRDGAGQGGAVQSRSGMVAQEAGGGGGVRKMQAGLRGREGRKEGWRDIRETE